jgi:hypothetical protein
VNLVSFKRSACRVIEHMTHEEMLQAMSTALTGPARDVPALRPPARADEIVGAEEELTFKFPHDYRLFWN